MPITTDSIVVAAKDQISTRVDDEAALLNLKTGVYFGLDPMGAYIWQMLREPVSVQTLTARLQEDYSNIDAEIVANDLRVFLDQMLEAGLVELVVA
jgi:hypothetical protein